WARRDIKVLGEMAWAWKNASTQAERDKIFQEFGARWSEFWRLPYWDPTCMLVIDGMHCVLEGLVHYHCRKVLRIDVELAKKKERGPIAFEQDWLAYDPSQLPVAYLMNRPDKEEKQIFAIQSRLMAPLVLEDSEGQDSEGPVVESIVPHGDEDQEMTPVPETGENAVAAPLMVKMRNALLTCNLPALRFVAYSLALDETNLKSKDQFTQKLISWRLTKPLVNPHFVSRALDLTKIKFIQRVIAKTSTPAWINSVPKNYGESNAGTIKADEWRILATIYLPIALILLWGDCDGEPAEGSEASRLLGMLDHSMALFQA
ncbi:hypothetical protein B0H12DRAFT_972004, partial [Mycena haematopus]